MERSSWRLVNRGCPQGSVLAPLLWNISQNDLIYSVDTGLTMYADDHQIYDIGKETCTIVSQLQQSATLATNWYDSNLLQNNLQKYQMMNIQSKRASNEQASITVEGEIITESENLKLLGMTIDSRLNINEHINNVCMKVSQRVSVLMRLRNLIPSLCNEIINRYWVFYRFQYSRIIQDNTLG